MKKIKPPKPQERIIHVKAESPVFSASVLVPESQCVSFLESVRDCFRRAFEIHCDKFDDCRLKVQPVFITQLYFKK